MKYNVEQYTPIAGKLLIKPLRPRTRMVENVELDAEKNKDLVPIKDEMQTKIVKVKAPFEIQLAEVLASGKGCDAQIGDTILYSVKFVKEFDLFKNTLLVSEYDLQGSYEI